MNEERIEIDNFDYFYRFSRMVAYCNMELSLDPKTRNQKENFIDELIDNSMYLIDNDELEDIISLVEISEIVDPYIKKDALSGKFYINDLDSHEFTTAISYKMVLRMYKNLEERGMVELCWDSDVEDFIYRPKYDENDLT